MTFSLAMLVFTLAAGAEPGVTARQVLKEDGVMVLSDADSYFTFSADGGFEAWPRGISGRTLSGRWQVQREQPLTIDVAAVQSWVNGLSKANDQRFFTFDIGGVGERRVTSPGIGTRPVKTIFTAPFTYEEIKGRELRLDLNPLDDGWVFRVFEGKAMIQTFANVDALRAFVATLAPGSTLSWDAGCKRSPDMPLLNEPKTLDAFIDFARKRKVVVTMMPGG